MKSRVQVARHALHPMLVVFPVGLLATSVVWDICYLASGNRSWGMISVATIVAGVVGALAAAIPGFVDWLAIPHGTRARRIGALPHGDEPDRGRAVRRVAGRRA